MVQLSSFRLIFHYKKGMIISRMRRRLGVYMKKTICLVLSLFFIPCILSANAYDSTKHGWGQGYNVNDRNQPIDCVKFNDKYAKYNATFLKSSENEIVLTFDEGYENGYTNNILDILKQNNVKAIFFITYDYAKSNNDIVKRMISEGHVIGNHTTNHPSTACISKEKLESEINFLHNYVKENFAFEMNLFRPPMGEFSQQSLCYTNELGYKSVFWSFAYKDYDINNQPQPDDALKRTIDALHPGAIYLLHAVSETNSQILDEFIKTTKQKGYKFTTDV